MLPQEFLQRMQHLLGTEYPAFLDSYHKERFWGLRVNPLKLSPDAFLQKASVPLRPVAWEPNGFYYNSSFERSFSPGKHPLHEAGAYYIQEPSAMAPAVYLQAQPNDRVLDLCAAPGGKSTQLAAAMQGQGLLVSNEIHPARAKILSANIERMGIRCCMVTNESPQALARVWEQSFDRILVDAPCSGEGMFRKNEAARCEWSTANIARCADRQLEILCCAAQMLRPGGRMVYSTCTFAPEENEGTVSRFLALHSEFSIVPVPKYEGMSPGICAWVANGAEGIEHTIRLFPHKLCGEGHYLAVLHKEGEPEFSRLSHFSGEAEPFLSRKDCGDYAHFAEQFLTARLSGGLVRFGDQLYLAPSGMPSTKGKKVLRPGLHLGTFRKNRFEPAHALALALHPEEVRHTCRLRSDSKEIHAYLSGQTFPFEGENGWYLVTADDCSIGWGKLVNGTMKNHYPKGLRIAYQ